MSEFHAHSFDSPRERPAPRELFGQTRDGAQWHHVLLGMTLIVAVKPQCDGCRDFVEGDLAELAGVEVVLVSAVDDDEWRDARRPVVVSPGTFSELDIRSAPFFVLIDPARHLVVAEGTLFTPHQVAVEISSFLPS